MATTPTPNRNGVGAPTSRERFPSNPGEGALSNHERASLAALEAGAGAGALTDRERRLIATSRHF